jgi:glycine/D-amino acid oxidase-like deaminating enzyme
MQRVVVVGCGIVGAAIAYELSHLPEFAVTVLDQNAPAQAVTGAALGVLMAAISQKSKGRNWHMRLRGVQTYDRWVPELEAKTGRRIPYNRQGILRLCFAGEDLERWRSLAAIRHEQGLTLEIWEPERIAQQYPHLCLDRVIGAVYSPGDRQLDPTAMTLALVAAAEQQGVTFRFGEAVVAVDVLEDAAPGIPPQPGYRVQTAMSSVDADWLVIAAGLGSFPLTQHLNQPVDIRPVLGQALHLRLKQPLGNTTLQPVITGDDVHLVPLGGDEYWIGATVEFPASMPTVIALQQPQAERLESVRQQAIALCPALQDGEILRTWSGLRPRPEGRPAPIIEHLPGYSRVVLATGHYRNGVLLAPATAERVRILLQADECRAPSSTTA